MTHFNRRQLWILLPVAWLCFSLALPLLQLVWICGADVDADVPASLWRIVTHRLYRSVLLNTVWLSLLVTLATLLVAYPIAYLIGHAAKSWSRPLMMMILASMWMSLLIRSYAWTVLLQKSGPLSLALVSLGVLDEGRSFMFTRFAVVIAMTHIMVPLMVVGILASVGSRLPALRLLATSLGATTGLYVLRVFLPASKFGAAAGTLMVFILSLGFYITPELMGGGRGETMMLAVLIDEQMSTLGNWQSGAALSLLLVVAVIAGAMVGFCFAPIRRWLQHVGADSV